MKVAIYVEGGGDVKGGRDELRRGFDALLAEQKSRARKQLYEWKVVMCGGRDEARRAFLEAVKENSDSLNILLVDSEGPVPDTTPEGRIAYLQQRDHWNLEAATPAAVHLMIQCMEAWLVADPAALEKAFGRGFRGGLLPKRQNLDEEPKEGLVTAITSAAKSTRTGRDGYRKIHHAHAILEKLDPDKVAARCPSFRTFRDWLTKAIGAG